MKKIFTILFGLVFVAVGIFSLMNGNKQIKNCTVETVGTVVQIKEEMGTEEDEDGITRTTYTYYPVIEYKAGDKTITKQYSTGSNSLKYKTNDKVDILYNPNNVEEYIIKGDKSSNILGVIFIVAGAFVSIAGVFVKNF